MIRRCTTRYRAEQCVVGPGAVGCGSPVIIRRDDGVRGLTREELPALPAAVDPETANRALSLSRTTGYDLAKRGRYPGTFLRLGSDVAGRPVTQGAGR